MSLMFKYLFGAFFAFFAVVGVCAVADARQAGINFRNASTNCAWITIYGRASAIGPWSIVSGDRPRNVKPGEYFPFRFTARNEIKVRAEVYRSGCNHPLAADFERSFGNVGGMGVVLKNNGSGFSLSSGY
jgi:hypothetical protein